MVIRSQDKRKITTDLNLYIEPRDNRAIGNVTCWIKNNTMGIVGSYSSWEKASSVLDMIYEQYQTSIHNCKVFQMPQDDEVIT